MSSLKFRSSGLENISHARIEQMPTIPPEKLGSRGSSLIRSRDLNKIIQLEIEGLVFVALAALRQF